MKRLFAALAVPLLLAVAIIGVTGAQGAMAAPLGGQGCIIGVVCLPGSSTPSPSSSAAPAPSASPSSSASPVPSASPTASAQAKSPALPVSVPSLPLVGGSSASPAAGLPGALIPALGASPAATSADAPKQAGSTSGIVVPTDTAVLTAQTAHITGFHYVGNVNLPRATGSSLTMMEFTADTVDLTGNVTVIVTHGDSAVTTVSTEQNFTGGVTLFSTQLSGTLVPAQGLPGVPLTLTPTTITLANLLKVPNAGELQLANLLTGAIPLTFTNVTTDQLLISGGMQVTTQLSMTVGPASQAGAPAPAAPASAATPASSANPASTADPTSTPTPASTGGQASPAGAANPASTPSPASTGGQASPASAATSASAATPASAPTPASTAGPPAGLGSLLPALGGAPSPAG